jgi:hypothetical protein
MSIGSELGLFHEKLQVELDIFNQVTNNQLYPITLFRPGGEVPAIYAGVKGLYSRGLELSATGELLRKKDLLWKVSGNFTVMANRIREPGDFFGIGNEKDKTNQPVGSWFQTSFIGVWNTPQEILDAGYPESRVPELLGMGRMSDNEDYLNKQTGSAFPNVLWGLSSTLRWRQFDVSLQIRGEHRQKIYNLGERYLHGAVLTNTTYYAMEKAWAPDRPYNNVPRQGAEYFNEAEPFYLQKGGFLRLQNVTIGYTIPVLKEKSARVFLSGQNLLLLTKYKGWDPEVSYYGQSILQRGQDFGAYPRAMTCSLGLQLHF